MLIPPSPLRHAFTVTGVVAALLFVSAAQFAHSAELKRETLDAWNEHLREEESSMQRRLDGGKPFLWIDEKSERRPRLLRGDVLVEPLTENGVKAVPNGVVHAWIGAVFIPDVTIETLFTVVKDYDRFKDIYKPAVADSRKLGANVTEQEFTMIWRRRVLFVNAAMQGWYRARESAVDANRRFSVVDSTRIQEIADYGRAEQRYLPPDQGRGFVWRVRSLVRYEQRDGGVYVEIEASALTRDIPASVDWLVSPIVRRLSMNSLTTTLEQTRTAGAHVRHERLALRQTPHGR